MDTKTFNQRFQLLTQREHMIDNQIIIHNTESIVNVTNGQVELRTVRISVIRHMNHDSFFDKTVENYITNKIIERDTQEEHFAAFTPDENFIIDYLDSRFNLISDELNTKSDYKTEPTKKNGQQRAMC